MSAMREARPLIHGWHVSTKQPFSLCMPVNSLDHRPKMRAGSAMAFPAVHQTRATSPCLTTVQITTADTIMMRTAPTG